MYRMLSFPTQFSSTRYSDSIAIRINAQRRLCRVKLTPTCIHCLEVTGLESQSSESVSVSIMLSVTRFSQTIPPVVAQRQSDVWPFPQPLTIVDVLQAGMRR